MTRRVLRVLLTDLQQIPTVVGESCTLGPVESAIRCCFRGVLSSGIKEEKFLSWAQSEPLVLLWIPTCYQLSASETVTHPVRCSVCGTFPITGLRYRCLKCLNFDICQLCFLSGRHRKSHERSHTVMEDCVQMSATENTKLLLRSLWKSLPQRLDRLGAVGRLDQLAPRDAASHPQTRLCIQYKGPRAPVYVRPTGTVEAAATEHSRFLCPRLSPALQANDNRHHQTGISIKKELQRARDSINALHREERRLRKRLNRYKHKLQGTYTLQEQNCRLETKIRELTANQGNLWTKLQQMRQDLQVMLRPLRPSSSAQNTVPKTDRSLPEDGSRRRGASSHSESATGDGLEWEPLPNSARADKSHKRPSSSEKAVSDSEPPEIISQSPGTPSHPQKIPREACTSPSALQQGLRDNPPMPAAEESSCARTPSEEEKRTLGASEKRIDLEEEDLQALLPRLLDAFDVDTPPGAQPLVDTELYGRAEQMCQAFSALVDQITLPSLE